MFLNIRIVLLFSICFFFPLFVQSQVAVDFIANKTYGCIPLQVTIKNTTPSKENYSFQWSLDESQTSTNIDSVNLLYAYYGSKTITLKALDAKGNIVGQKTKSQYIKVLRNPIVSFTKNLNVVCKGSDIVFTPKVDFSDAPIKSWWWEFGDGTFDTNKTPTHLFNDVRDSAVQLLVFDTNGCSNGENRARELISVQEHAPSAFFAFSKNEYATCDSSYTLSFINTSVYNFGTITNYSWKFPDGTTSNSATPQAFTVNRKQGTSSDEQIFTLSVTADNGCVNTMSRSFIQYNFKPTIHLIDTVKPLVSLEHLDSMACPGSLVIFKAGGDNIATIQWDLNKANTFTYSTQLVDTFIVPKTIANKTMYTLTLRANSGVCTKDIQASFTVEPNIKYQITPYDSFYCSTPQKFQCQIVQSNIPARKVMWYIDSISFNYKSDTIIHPLTYFATTNTTSLSRQYRVISNHSYDMKVAITTDNQCFSVDTFPHNVMVYIPTPKFVESVSNGCAPALVDFTDKSRYWTPAHRDFIDSIYWLAVDTGKAIGALPLTSVSHNYLKEGFYKTKLTIHTHKGCTLDAFDNVQFGSKQTVKYVLKDTVVCALEGALYLDSSTDPLKVDAVHVSFSHYDSTSHRSLTTGTISSYPAIPKTDTTIVPHPNTKVTFKTLNDSLKVPAYMLPGFYDIAVTVSYNGCLSNTVFKKNAVKVSGPWIYTKSVTQKCSEPYKASINIDTLRDATSWFCKLLKYDKSVYKVVDTIYSPDAPQPNYHFVIDSVKYGTGHYLARMISYKNQVVGIPQGCADSSEIHFAVTDTHMDFAKQSNYSCIDSNRWICFTPLNDKTLIQKISWKATTPDGTIDSVDSKGKHNHVYEGHNLYDPHQLYYNYPPMYTKETFPYDTILLNQFGVYKIVATAIDINNCVSTKIDSIEAYSPKADFTKASISECLPFMMRFFDKSTYKSPIVTWKWTMPDAMNISNDTNYKDTIFTIKHINSPDTVFYNKKQQYTAILEVTDSLGCKGSKTKINYVTPIIPSTKFTLPNPKVCVGNEVTFVRSTAIDSLFDVNVDSVRWSFIDTSFTLHKKDSNFNAFNLSFKHEFINKRILVTSYLTTPSKSICTNTDSTFNLDVRDARAANPKLVNDTINCYVGRLQMNASTVNTYSSIEWAEIFKKKDGSDSITYKGVSANPEIMISNVGIHRFRLHTLSDYVGCTDQHTDLTYNIDRSDFKIFTDVNEVCINQNIHFNIKDTLNIKPHKFHWYYNDGNSDSTNIASQHAYSNVTGNIRVIFAVDNSCRNFDSVRITVRKVIADFNRGTSDDQLKGCPPFKIQFLNKSQGAVSYNWDFGDGSSDNSINPTHIFGHPDTTYNVKLSIKGTLCSDDTQKTVKVMVGPIIKTNYKSTICQDSVLGLEIKTNKGTSITKWNDSPAIISLDSSLELGKVKPEETSVFIINSKNENNGEFTCYKSDSILVKVQQRPYYTGAPKDFLVFVPNDTLFEKPKDELYGYTLYSLNNDSLPGIRYSWNPSEALSCSHCANPNVTLTKNMNYTVTMSDSLGCFIVIENLNLKVLLETEIGLPTAFTPNIDGSNDVVIPRGWGVKEFLTMQIFNRWGEVVYESNDMEKGWDGNFKGHPQDADTFAWTITFKDYKDLIQKKKGYITLLR